ncbi:MAG: ATP-grasp domain-containing protein [Planctomycetes bacterium]|nr:ATP-grasp domain-containing protein [Planctomycetota bacterium]
MKILVYEFISGGGLAGNPLPDSLRTEGLAMLRSLVEDLSRIPGVQVSCTLDERFEDHVLPAEVTLIGRGVERRALEDLASEADFSLVIAPEFDCILLERSKWLDGCRARRIGPSLDAIELTSNKLALARHLVPFGIPAVGGCIFDPERGLPARDFAWPAVLKPLYGAGSQATFLIRNDCEAHEAGQRAIHEGLRRNAILQRYCPGQPASVSFLLGPRRAVILMPCTQNLSADGRFRYLGGRSPISPELARRAMALAAGAVASVPGLLGYAGVDLILGQPKENDVVMEINPRLTTSYVGLRALADTNLAETLLHLFLGEDAPPVSWKPQSVFFSSRGEVRLEAL